MRLPIDRPAAPPALWPLDPTITFLNHGSFGACPRAVLDHQKQLRDELERDPVQFFVRDFEGRWDKARAALARFLGADASDLVFVPNATTGINTVLRSLRLKPGDELLVTNHEYNATRNALEYAAQLWKARIVLAAIPFPGTAAGAPEEAILARVTRKTKLALLDHVTSQTGMILPLERLARDLEKRKVRVLVDGAHAPGMLPLDLEKVNASYYTGNCHKWLCAPKGAAFLHVRRDRQREIRPLIISHGANSRRKDRSRFLLEFGWTGTGDPTAALSVPFALDYLRKVVPGGWPALMRRNRELALAAREILCRKLEVPLPCPDTFIGSLASVPLPDSRSRKAPRSPLYLDPLQEQLFKQHRIEVPVIPWPQPPKRLLRISAQAYNSVDEYERLTEIVSSSL